jgi:hypothetical protein
MKKLFITILIVLAILGITAIIGIAMFMNSIIKQGVETAGPKVTQVEVKLDGVNVSLFSGKGEIKGLVLGNPAGFTTPNAVKVGKAGVVVKPGSIFSDKVIIESVSVEAPEITIEGGLKDNNLTKILANINSAVGKGSPGAPAPAGDQKSKPSKKLQVNDFAITGGKINLRLAILGGKATTVPLPDIHFKDLGQGPAGITAEELLNKVFQAITEHSLKAAVTAASAQGIGAVEAALGASPGATNSIGKAAQGIGDLFKKKN